MIFDNLTNQESQGTGVVEPEPSPPPWATIVPLAGASDSGLSDSKTDSALSREGELTPWRSEGPAARVNVYK